MYYIHINRGVIDSNRKRGKNAPPIVIKKGKTGRGTYCHGLRFTSGTIIYNGARVLPCGARVVIQTDTMPEIINAHQEETN